MTAMEFSIAHYQDGLTHVTVYPSRAAAIEARHGEFAGRVAIVGQRPVGSDGPWETITDELPPGVYGMADEAYHKHPALSASGAKLLLPPSCPALFRYERDHPAEHNAVFDFGHAAHQTILGAGPKIAALPFDNWMTKAAKEARAAAYEDDSVPLLQKDAEIVTEMALALRDHPLARRLFAEGTGKPEQSLFWTDKPSGVDRRGRLDWLPNPRPDGRLILPDYKTSVSAAPQEFSKSMANFGYAQQAAWYIDGAKALELAANVRFIFVVQCKTAPYLITVFEPDAEALRIGDLLNRRAIDLYAECLATDTWPGYSDDVELLALPYWFQRQFEEAS